MAEIDGATVIARSLKQQGVDYMFGVVGFPVAGVAAAAQREGIHYFGFHNEQAASYAAGAVGYLTGRPGACLTVCGPGMIHGIAGMANAWSNTWPMILIGGAPDSYQDGQGSFQEAPQVEAARPFAKMARRAESIERVPYYVEQAVRTSMYGRPGAVYLDFANDVISGRIEDSEVAFRPRCPDAPRTYAEPSSIDAAVDALKSAERPLVIVGKGMAYARAEDEVREFIDKTQLPFLASPMGKGVVPDDHPLSVAPARSHALQNADLVFLMGARMNWIMHFGLPPRFNKDVRVVQMDISAEEIGTNVPTEVALVGDAKAITSQLNAVLEQSPWSYPQETRGGRGSRPRPRRTARPWPPWRWTTRSRWATTACCGPCARRSPRTRSLRARARGWISADRAPEHHAALAARCGHVRHDGRGRGPGDRGRGVTARSWPWRAMPASASARWRSRWPAATTCRSRSSS